MFTVRPKYDVSLHGLIKLQSLGYFVARSSHIGNHFLSNLVLLAVGVKSLLFDRNLFQKDHNNRPGVVVYGNRVESLGYTHGLVPFGGRAVTTHLSALCQLYPGLWQTEAEYFLKHREVVEKMFCLMAERMPQVFDRYLCTCGDVHKTVMFAGFRVAECSVCGRHSFSQSELAESAMGLVESIALAEQGHKPICRSGILWSLPLHMVLESVLNVLDSGRDEVYQISGPDMIRYTRNHAWLEEIRHVWGVLQNHGPRFGLNLPSQVAVHIVPTADVRFSYIQGHEPGQLVVEGLLGLEQLKRDRTSPARANYLAQVRENLPAWNVFYDIQDQVTWPCSQHDLVEAGARLIVPEQIMTMTMTEVSRLYSDSGNRLAAKRRV